MLQIFLHNQLSAKKGWENAMTTEELYSFLKEKFYQVLDENGIRKDSIEIMTKSLTPEEAIGITKRKDFPIITGKEVMVQASYRGGVGQAFTDAPTVFKGSIEEICQMDLADDDRARGLFIATVNAVMNYLGKAENVVHCRNNGPEECAVHVNEYIKKHYGNPKITLVGYQPSMLESLAADYQLRVLDLSPANIGKNCYGVVVEHGIDDYADAISWADLILCTGSTICNGSIVNFLDLDKEVLFFGTTISGSADWLGVKRLCFADVVGVLVGSDPGKNV